MARMGGFVVIALVALSVPLANATVVCSLGAASTTVRSEGLTEAVGDIILTCNGNAGEQISGNLLLFLSVNITNRLVAANALDVTLTADTGSGPVAIPGVTAAPFGANGIAFNGVSVAVPTPAAPVLIRISNLHGAVAQQGVSNTAPILATLTFGASSVIFTNTQVTVGSPQRSLLATINSAVLSCTGSPAPSTISVPDLISAGTVAYTTRVMEAFASAFEPVPAGATNGVRILLRYTGFLPTAKVFVPELVAGSNALQPTSGGDLGTLASGGQYQTSTQGSLLLALVPDADANGAGGTPVATKSTLGSEPVTLNAAREVTLTGGSGVAVYEVIDANPGQVERAQIPTFVSLPSTGGAVANAGSETVTLAPVSGVNVASATAPILRFVDTVPPPDCSVADCSAFPHMTIDLAQPFTFTAAAGSAKQGKTAYVRSTSGSINWNATLTYGSGSGWAQLVAGANYGPHPGWVQVFVDPTKVGPGTYAATVTIDAGPIAGSQTFPVSFTVTPATTPHTDGPNVAAAVNAASFEAGPLVPGSIAALFGERLSGKDVSATFDTIPATLFYVGAIQINLLVPPELAHRPSAQLVVTVDGVSSAPLTISLTSMAPAVFGTGVLNQDWSQNSASTPAARGSVLILYGTGLPTAADGTVTATFGGRDLGIEYAGPAPGLPGVQQVNARIPGDATVGTADLVVCGNSITSMDRACSRAVKATVR